MKPSSAVVSCVDDHSLACTVFSEEVGIHGPETLGVHSFDMYISYLSAGKFLDHLFPLSYPPFIKLRNIGECRLDVHLDLFLTTLLYGDGNLFAALQAKERIPKLEERIMELEEELFGDAASNYVRAAQIEEEKAKIEEELLELYELVM